MSHATLATRFDPSSQPAAPAIDVQHVNHSYGTDEARKQVLFDNCLTVRSGEIVIMTGQSGSGKTTLLTLIGTLRKVQEGELWVLGHPLHEANAARILRLRRRLGFIFQAHNLFASLTALQNVRMALELHDASLTRNEADERCRQVLEAVGLERHIHDKPGRLSGGQKQRVAVARGLVHQPDILLADEPTAALDKESGQRVVSLFEEQARNHNMAVVIVTHDHQILNVADRIVKMDFGHIVRDSRVYEASLISEMLRECPVFDGVAFSTLTRLADQMNVERFPAGTRIIRQGDPGDRFYLLRRGRLAVTLDPGNRRIAKLGPGQCFGEAALITGEPRNANVDALTEAVVFSLNAEVFKSAMAERRSCEEEVRCSLAAD